jgi:RHS repeat-associated protein
MLKNKHFTGFLLSITIIFISLLASATELKPPSQNATAVLNIQTKLLYVPALDIPDNKGNLQTYQAVVKIKNDDSSNIPIMELIELQPINEEIAEPHAIYDLNNQTVVIPSVQIGSTNFYVEFNPIPSKSNEYKINNLLLNANTKQDSIQNFSSFNIATGLLHIPYFLSVDNAGKTHVYDLQFKLVDASPITFSLVEAKLVQNYPSGSLTIYEPVTNTVQVPNILVESGNSPKKSFQAAFNLKQSANSIQLIISGLYSLPNIDNSLIATQSNNIIDLSWLPARNSTTNINYEIHVGEERNFIPSDKTLKSFVKEQTKYQLSNLIPDKTYYVLIIAVDRYGKRSLERDYIPIQYKNPLIDTSQILTSPVIITEPVYGSNPKSGSEISFGKASVGNFVSKNIEIGNLGNAPLVVDFVTIENNNSNAFQISPVTFPFTLSEKSSKQLEVKCSPTQAIAYQGLLKLSSNDKLAPQVTYKLTCDGFNPLSSPSSDSNAPTLVSEPSLDKPIDFGSSELGITKEQQIQITTNGASPLKVDLISIDGDSKDFKVVSTLPFSIDLTNNSKQIVVQCTPSQTGDRKGILRLTSNAAKLPEIRYSLKCNGILPTNSLSTPTQTPKATTPSTTTGNNTTTGGNTSGGNVGTIVPVPNVSQPNPNTQSLITVDSQKITPGQARKIRYEEAEINIPAGAVENETTLSIEPLPEVIELDAGMTNVTKGNRKGYRFLPHGIKFKEKVQLRIPYDKTLIPVGQTEQDIKIYYFDEQIGRWREIERVGIDTQTQEIIGNTDHFTDFISATLTTPDSPEAASYNKNQMKDIKAADPSSQISLIDPPKATNMGDANLHYPIQLPAGRVGMQPELALQYSSGSGNGWMGLGWDLSVPSINIDTRWGVPLYSPTQETETYLLGGQLTPIVHRSALQPRVAEKVFHSRIEGSFQKIIRHGDNPKNYWWEVTSKDGKVFYYGGNPSAGVFADAVLTDYQGNVFQWFLHEVRDVHGNNIQYQYTKVEDVGLIAGTVLGYNLYLKTIYYTGYNKESGPYQVNFIRDRDLKESRRIDVSIDARGAFKKVTADLLRKIEISYQKDKIRSYEFKYKQGAFQKTLLDSISQYGIKGTLFNTHTFDYYDEIRDSNKNYQGFSSASNWATGNDNVSIGLFGKGNASALGGNKSLSTDIHLYLGLAMGGCTKDKSIGGKIGGQFGESEGKLILVDINGDGLEDKVYKKGGIVYYRPNRSGPNGTSQFGEERVIANLGALSEDKNRMFSGGGELYFIGNIGFNVGRSYSESNVYITDVNGDKLPDLVAYGQVLFNSINANGDPVFTPNSMDTPYPIGQGAIDANKILGNLNELREQQIDAFPLLDSVRRWTAPYDGNIQITGNVALRQDGSSERSRYMTADGVRVAIQLNQSELWSTTISATDYAPKQPSNIENISVKQGDTLYFRVQSVFDGAYDQIDWQPDIQYMNTIPFLDANLLDVYHYNGKEDFTLASYRGVRLPMPIKGTVSLAGTFQKIGSTSDNITLQIFKNNEILIEKPISWDQISTIEINQEIQVVEQDTLYARVKIDSPIDLRNLIWQKALTVTYKQADKPDIILVDEQGNPTIKFELWPDFDLYPITNLKEPLLAWQAPSTGTYTVSPLLAMSPNNTDVNGEFVVTVKKAGQLGLLAKQLIPVINGMVGNAEFTFQANQGDKVYVEISTRDFNLVEKLSQKQIGIQGQEIPTAFYEPSQSLVIPRTYRGWTALAYNGNRERANQPINITQKDLDGSTISETMTDLQNKTQQLTTDSEPSVEIPTQKIIVFPLYPHWEANAWREASGDTNFWISGQTLSSSRQGPDYISVPTPAQFSGASAVPRISTSENLGFMAGISAISASFSRTNSKGIIDFLDMNGDGFPDIVGNGHVQFSQMVGGLSSLALPILGGDVRGSKSNSFNIGASGTFPKGRRNIMASLGGGITKGDAEAKYDLMDMNGDGITDKVSVQGGQLWVQLGLGYGFAPAELWGNASLNQSNNMGLNLGISGFNDGVFGFAGSINLGGNKADTKATLLDINGDGLLDRVVSASGGLIVGLNTGNGFGADIFWPNALGDVNNNMDITLGGGVYVTIPIPLPVIPPMCIIINPGGDLTQTMSRPETSIRDIDGDGYPDYLQSTSDSSITAALNPIGRTNLLKTVHRPLGASFNLEYQRNGNTYADPHSRWNMSRVSIYDGHVGDGVDTTSTTYQYKDGFYHRQERDFYGYKTVVEAVRDTQDAIYRTTTSEYLNDSFYSKGLLYKQTTADALGNKYHETENAYVFRNVETQRELANKHDLVATVFPELRRVDTRFYEGQATAGKMTYELHEYNATGDIIRFIDGGDIGTEDDVEAIVEYYINSAKHIFKPQTITVSANGKVMRKRSGDFDSNGDLTQLRQYLEDGSSATTDIEYDRYGNITRKTRPANHRGQRYSLEYLYDSTIFTYNTQVKDSFGYISSGEHDLLCGAVKKTVDLNKQPITYTFDEFCRIETITSPYQAGTRDVTLRFDYHPNADTPWALTQHYDAYHPNDPIETVVLIDGLKRAIQTKKDNTIHTGETGNPKDMMTVTGHQEFDFLGRTVKQWYPVTENLGKQGIFNPQIDDIPPSITTYDVIDRPLSITAPDNTTTKTEYGFGNDRKGQLQFLTRVTDANGIAKETYKDVDENITSVKEFNNKGTQIIWTSYEYDPLNQIIKVIDDKKNQTLIDYDNLGRRLWIDSPDAGKTETVYDLASNPIKKITANLKAQGKAIEYTYDFTHLIEIRYPNFSGNNVTYTYGSAGAPYNRAGRIVTVTDQSGTEERFYGVLGETVKTIKTVASSTQGNSTNSPEIYTTEYVYDTWNRLHKLTYPDGEILTNEYDSGGLVNKIFGDKAGWHYDYVNRLEYDKFEQRTFVEVGNKTRSSYSYNPYNRRLANLKAGNSMGNGALFQNLTYNYDKVGNILGQANSSKVTSASQMGGATNYVYGYDDLYRLISAHGTYDTMPNKQHVFRLSMEYDTVHNILHKNQYHELIQPSTTPIIQKKETYDWLYGYQGSQPHAPTHIYDATAGTDGKVGGRTFIFDANGNQIGWTDYLNGTRRNIVWDDENRIQSIFDNGHEKTYKYDHAGERVIKQGPQGETVYINPYFSIRNREVGTKHIMAGSTRIVTKMMKQDKPNSNPNGKVPEEKDLYFYHPDHLGSSAYITDAKGGIYQHLEYLPFGETWAEETSSTQRTPYWFTAKELDEETGLYYFGARYYDVRTSVWNAVDPILGSYLDGKRGMGGVFNPFNMGLYTYTHLNPIKYIDPDGNEVNFAKGIDNSVVSSHSIDILNSLTTGENATITSTTRSPAKQANAMFTNIIQKGVDSQKKLYASSGDAVIDVYVQQKANGATDEQIKSAMTQKIENVGPSNVSKHCANSTILNVVDISPSTIKDKKAFDNALTQAKKDGLISKFIKPGGGEPVYHIEIPQQNNVNILTPPNAQPTTPGANYSIYVNPTTYNKYGSTAITAGD